MAWAVTTVFVLLVLCVTSALRSRAEKRRALLRVAMLEAREAEFLGSARGFVAACRLSAAHVRGALDRALRATEPLVDAFLFCDVDGDELHCVAASGPRAGHFLDARWRRSDGTSALASASLHQHRVHLGEGSALGIPGDRWGIAIPMCGGTGLLGVVYCSSSASSEVRSTESLVRLVDQVASAYELAGEREADHRRATYDGLTGLFTARAFRAKFSETVDATRIAGRGSVALWFIDTDHFKWVNDTFGHAAGDVVLQRMAATIGAHLTPGTDAAGRNGGDEFCAFLGCCEKSRAIQRATHLCEAVSALNLSAVFGGVPHRIGASIGVAAFPYDARHADRLLEIADAAMYHSKRQGRGRVSFSTDGKSFRVFEPHRRGCP